jgi:predicted dehydrogenase
MGVLLNSSTMLAAEATTEIYGDQGVMIQNYGDLSSSSVPRPPHPIALKLYRTDDPQWRDLGLPADTAQGERIAAVARPVVDYLRGRRGPIATAAEGRVGVEMILAAYRSAEEGRRITL